MESPTREDVWLCIHLYEQRREPELRAARDWMSTFTPTSFKEIQAVIDGKKGLDANRHWRQITSYWEMIATLMLSGGLSAAAVELFAKTTKEWFFHWSKVAPFIDEIRAYTRPTAHQNLEALCRSLTDYDDLMAYFSRANERMRKLGRGSRGPAKAAPRSGGAAKSKKASKPAGRARR